MLVGLLRIGYLQKKLGAPSEPLIAPPIDCDGKVGNENRSGSRSKIMAGQCSSTTIALPWPRLKQSIQRPVHKSYLPGVRALRSKVVLTVLIFDEIKIFLEFYLILNN